MLRLIDLLKETRFYSFKNSSHLFPTDAKEAAQFGIVISHKKGITDEEAKKIIDLYNKDDKDSDLKYFPATKKIVGKVGVFRFFMPGKVSVASVKMAPSLDKARLKYELDKVKSGLEIDRKTIYK